MLWKKSKKAYERETEWIIKEFAKIGIVPTTKEEKRKDPLYSEVISPRKQKDSK